MFIVVGLVLLCCYFLYKPVPSGFPDPWKYRLTVTAAEVFMSLYGLKMLIRDFRRPSSSYDVMMEVWSKNMTSTPLPPAEVPGSNIKSRLASFGGIKVRVYEPKDRVPGVPLPAFLYLHGGGLVIGTIDFFDRGVRMISERLNITGIAVSYRLAPQHTFPAAFDDTFAATKWLLSHAEEVGVDPGRVALMGDSAGSLLTAAVSAAISDDPSVPDIKLQVMIYPWLQSLDLNTPSYQKMRQAKFGTLMDVVNLMPNFMSAAVLGSTDKSIVGQISTNQHTSRDFKRSLPYRTFLDHSIIPSHMKPACYRPPSPDDDDEGNEKTWESMKDVLTSLEFSPLLREDMTKLPRTFIATCGYDVLRDDGIFYADRLKKAGVPVEWVNYENGFHGIQWVGDRAFVIGRQMANDFINYTKEHL
ncbi:arylacetamide deacetylase-like [Diadema setosum]|uniref:arylacetamide deacetylase-like n=1 Tax=Diadema setosum TaxID=31175 RepID=UPI003B3A58D8